MTTIALTEQFDGLTLADLSDEATDPMSSPAPSHTGTFSSRGERGESISSHSSNPTQLHSDGGCAPSRPQRSPLRCGNAELLLISDEMDALQREMSAVLDKIYEIEELRHSPTMRSAHASRLDTLLSEVNQCIESLAPRVASVPVAIELSELHNNFRKDWARVTSQHALLKQEMLEDPWLIRFRTTADQADGMMDPLQNSLVELTAYVGRILSSVSVPVVASESTLSIQRLRDMAAAHGRLKATYVPSVNRILKMMAKSIADRSVTNGEALRRLNDMTTAWVSLQRHLTQLDGKVDLVLAQNDPENPQLDDLETLEDDHMFVGSPRVLQIPKLELEVPPMESGLGLSVHRMYNGVPTSNSIPPAHHGIPPPSSFSGLQPPSSRNGTGSVTPNAQRSLRRSISRATLSKSTSTTSLGKPRWNVSTKPLPELPSPSLNARRPSHSSGYGPTYTPSHTASLTPSHASSHSSTRRPSTPASTPDSSRIPQRTPLKTTGGSVMSTPSHSRSAGNYGTPSQMSQRSTLSGARTPSGRQTPLNRFGASTPSGTRQHMRARTPAGGRMSLASSSSAASRPSVGSGGRPSLAPTLSRLPPSSWGSRSPAAGSVSRASSRMSSTSITMANVELSPFVPSRYDLLDQEVQKVLDVVQPNFFVARVDTPLRRGQRKGEGEMWVGEFLFGSGGRPTSVKLLELGSRKGPDTGKRVKTMARAGGAWTDLTIYLMRKKEEISEEILDDE